MYRYLSVMAATAALSMVMAGTPALSQDAQCGELSGAAFGLCNAYCEAMACESGNPQATDNACMKVKSKYDAIGAGALPCLSAANAAPSVDLDINTEGTGSTATFVSFGDAVPIAVDAVITDTDVGDMITSATVTLTNPVAGDNESLSLSPAGHVLLADFGGAVAGEGTTILTITGTGTQLEYAEVLQQVVYDNPKDSPTTDPDRSIQVIVTDIALDGSAPVTSVMAVEVGCPCPSFSSDIIINTALSTYETSRGSRSGCDSSGDNCYASPFVFGAPQDASCTAGVSDTTRAFRYDVNINLFSPTTTLGIDFRRFEIEVGTDRCILRQDRTTFIRGADVKEIVMNEVRIDSTLVPPFEFVSPFTTAMEDACVAEIPRLKGLLIDFWEGAAGIAKFPRCNF